MLETPNTRRDIMLYKTHGDFWSDSVSNLFL